MLDESAEKVRQWNSDVQKKQSEADNLRKSPSFAGNPRAHAEWERLHKEVQNARNNPPKIKKVVPRPDLVYNEVDKTGEEITETTKELRDKTKSIRSGNAAAKGNLKKAYSSYDGSTRSNLHIDDAENAVQRGKSAFKKALKSEESEISEVHADLKVKKRNGLEGHEKEEPSETGYRKVEMIKKYTGAKYDYTRPSIQTDGKGRALTPDPRKKNLAAETEVEGNEIEEGKFDVRQFQKNIAANTRAIGPSKTSPDSMHYTQQAARHQQMKKKDKNYASDVKHPLSDRGPWAAKQRERARHEEVEGNEIDESQTSREMAASVAKYQHEKKKNGVTIKAPQQIKNLRTAVKGLAAETEIEGNEIDETTKAQRDATSYQRRQHAKDRTVINKHKDRTDQNGIDYVKIIRNQLKNSKDRMGRTLASTKTESTDLDAMLKKNTIKTLAYGQNFKKLTKLLGQKVKPRTPEGAKAVKDMRAAARAEEVSAIQESENMENVITEQELIDFVVSLPEEQWESTLLGMLDESNLAANKKTIQRVLDNPMVPKVDRTKNNIRRTLALHKNRKKFSSKDGAAKLSPSDVRDARKEVREETDPEQIVEYFCEQEEELTEEQMVETILEYASDLDDDLIEKIIVKVLDRKGIIAKDLENRIKAKAENDKNKKTLAASFDAGGPFKGFLTFCQEEKKENWKKMANRKKKEFGPNKPQSSRMEETEEEIVENQMHTPVSINAAVKKRKNAQDLLKLNARVAADRKSGDTSSPAHRDAAARRRQLMNQETEVEGNEVAESKPDFSKVKIKPTVVKPGAAQGSSSKFSDIKVSDNFDAKAWKAKNLAAETEVEGNEIDETSRELRKATEHDRSLNSSRRAFINGSKDFAKRHGNHPVSDKIRKNVESDLDKSKQYIKAKIDFHKKNYPEANK